MGGEPELQMPLSMPPNSLSANHHTGFPGGEPLAQTQMTTDIHMDLENSASVAQCEMKAESSKSPPDFTKVTSGESAGSAVDESTLVVSEQASPLFIKDESPRTAIELDASVESDADVEPDCDTELDADIELDADTEPTADDEPKADVEVTTTTLCITSTKIAGQRRPRKQRSKFTADRKAEVEQIRNDGACIRCRVQKGAVSISSLFRLHLLFPFCP